MSQLFPPINFVYPVFTYHKIEQHEDTEIVPTEWFRFTNLLYCAKKISIMAIPAIPLLLGYTILTVMHWFEVHSIVTGTLIYPIILVNYAAKEVGQSLFTQNHPTRIKFTLMQLSTEILILSVVVWHDLFISKP